MNRWIPINIKWNRKATKNDYKIFDKIKQPNLDEEMKTKFGYTIDEFAHKIFPDLDKYKFVSYHPAAIEFIKEKENLSDLDCNLYSNPSAKKLFSRLRKLNNKLINSFIEYKAFEIKVQDWVHNHPKTKAFNKIFYETRENIKNKIKHLSFCGKDLNVPGTLVEFKKSRNGKIHQMLLGNLDKNGGVSSYDFQVIKDNYIITRYKVVFRKS